MATRRRSTANKSAKAASAPVKKSPSATIVTKYSKPLEINKVTETPIPAKDRPAKPNLSLEDYKADFKVRWQIHTYEVNELGSDIKKGYEYVLPIVKKVVNYSTETYKNLQTRFATVD